MATIDTTRWATNLSPREGEERGSSLDDLFGRRHPRANAWYQETDWLRAATSAPEQEETVLRHDEVTLAGISMSQGRVVIALSDEQAEQALRIAEGR